MNKKIILCLVIFILFLITCCFVYGKLFVYKNITNEEENLLPVNENANFVSQEETIENDIIQNSTQVSLDDTNNSNETVSSKTQENKQVKNSNTTTASKKVSSNDTEKNATTIKSSSSTSKSSSSSNKSNSTKSDTNNSNNNSSTNTNNTTKKEEKKTENVSTYKINNTLINKMRNYINNNVTDDMKTYGYNIVVDNSIVNDTNYFTYTDKRMKANLNYLFGTIKIYARDLYVNGAYAHSECFIY